MSRSIPLDTQQAVDRVIRLMAIPGISGCETAVSEAIIAELTDAGAAIAQFSYDDANTRTRLAGEVGNLIFHLPGKSDLPARLLTAHMDTVPICEGAQPAREGDQIVSTDPATGLGADDRAGCAAILTAALEALKLKGDHPPLVFGWLIQEEVGLQGARNLDVGKIGDVGLAFNFDGGTVDKLTVGATGGERMEIKITGRPSHAGVAPEQGISAIAIASLAIARLHNDGWHGRIEKPEGRGTSNVGVIQGGQATNVVTPEVNLRVEARSHDSAMRTRIVDEIRSAFQWAATQVTAADGSVGQIEFSSHLDYDSFRIDDDAPSVRMAAAAVEQLGRKPYTELAGGGLDANWLYKHGIPAVTLGCGQRNIHTANETLEIDDYLDACRVAIALACDTTSGV
ncbi:Carboxypeptidase G2 precursor [Rosistilla oblonga]|uniref:Carboxypeptidase G2 n=1 Tax=Rosistilla oblonga TaxID=2527990 RepID=A0A518IU77_9BACT|nr:M20/M25/M40 family metallo-hydrolase [Rosistilla oblonga]QDV15210.1 Carboxypeptidase G2 precursor [Rosistilla oblonga]QDV56639.1 Carboxypeptidase G2 precursor [Rosistilla oblonga]